MCEACKGFDVNVFETGEFETSPCICTKEEEYCNFGRLSQGVCEVGEWEVHDESEWNIEDGKVKCTEDCWNDCEVDITKFPKWAQEELAKLGVLP